MASCVERETLPVCMCCVQCVVRGALMASMASMASCVERDTPPRQVHVLCAVCGNALIGMMCMHVFCVAVVTHS